MADVLTNKSFDLVVFGVGSFLGGEGVGGEYSSERQVGHMLSLDMIQLFSLEIFV